MKLPASTTEPQVRQFLSLWKLEDDPLFLNYEDVGFGYERDFCHVSAKHVVEKRGGRRVHGWNLWQFDDPEGKSAPMIVGEFHSVWETPTRVIKDITPPKLGTRTLFVRDPSLAIQAAGDTQLLHSNRTNDSNFPLLFNGTPTDAEYFAIANNQPSLVAYYQKLGLPVTSML